MSDNDSTIFTDDKSEETTVIQPSAPSYEDLLAQVANGKYRTVEDALKSIPHAQSHIEKLEAEMAQLREELTRRKAMEDVLKEIKTAPVVSEDKQKAVPAQPIDISAAVKAEIAKANNERIAAQHRDEVANTLVGIYGTPDKANEFLVAKAKELGVSVSFLDSIALQSPKAFFEVLGVERKNTPFPQKTLESSVSPNLQNKEPATDYLAKFKGTDSTALLKWRKAKEAITN